MAQTQQLAQRAGTAPLSEVPEGPPLLGFVSRRAQGSVAKNAIPQDRLNYYGGGACQIFAMELNRLTKWPIYYLHTATQPKGCVHAVCRAPDGQYVDIAGKRRADQIEADYRGRAGKSFQAKLVFRWRPVSVSENARIVRDHKGDYNFGSDLQADVIKLLTVLAGGKV